MPKKSLDTLYAIIGIDLGVWYRSRNGIGIASIGIGNELQKGNWPQL